MRTRATLSLSCLVAIALLGSHASTIRADDRAKVAPTVNVALHEGGVAYGQLLDMKRQPVRNQEVRIVAQGRLLVAVKTNELGQFAIQGLRSGPHIVESGTVRRSIQLWAPRTAPPSAGKIATIVASRDDLAKEPVVRGQVGGGYGPAIRGAVAGGLVTGLTYWALDYNANGS